MGARRYSPSTGRWLQQDIYYQALDNLDLSQDPLNQNRYLFTGANPINYVEADGHILTEGPGGGGQPSCKDVSTAMEAAGQCQNAAVTQAGETGSSSRGSDAAEYSAICRDLKEVPYPSDVLKREMQRCAQLRDKMQSGNDWGWLQNAWNAVVGQHCSSSQAHGWTWNTLTLKCLAKAWNEDSKFKNKSFNQLAIVVAIAVFAPELEGVVLPGLARSTVGVTKLARAARVVAAVAAVKYLAKASAHGDLARKIVSYVQAAFSVRNAASAVYAALRCVDARQ